MKKIIGMIIVATIIFASAWNISQNKDVKLSTLALNNIEALADNEVDVGEPCVIYPTTCYVINDEFGHTIISGYR